MEAVYFSAEPSSGYRGTRHDDAIWDKTLRETDLQNKIIEIDNVYDKVMVKLLAVVGVALFLFYLYLCTPC